MNRDKSQLRWRKTYKGESLQVTPSELGGTGYNDTVVLANRWFSSEKERIDAEIAAKKRQPMEEEYLAEHEEMQTAIKVLSRIKNEDPAANQLIETMKVKCRDIRQTPQNEDTPAPGLALLNPLKISVKQLEELTENEEAERMFCSLLDEYLSNKHSETWLNVQGYISHLKNDVLEPNNLEWSLGIRMGVYPDPSTGRTFGSVTVKGSRKTITPGTAKRHSTVVFVGSASSCSEKTLMYCRRSRKSTKRLSTNRRNNVFGGIPS